MAHIIIVDILILLCYNDDELLVYCARGRNACVREEKFCLFKENLS